VNTGKFVGKTNRLEDTIVKTNVDAVNEIVRQVRLRDLGGIIVIDFIDMDERKNRQKVMQTLEDAMRADRAPYKILQFNDFGLVAITRKRVKQSLERTLCTPCPYCEGAGYVKSPQTVVGEILGEAQKIAAALEGTDVMLRVSPEVAKLLKSNQNTYLQELEEVLGHRDGQERSAAPSGKVRFGVSGAFSPWRGLSSLLGRESSRPFLVAFDTGFVAASRRKAEMTLGSAALTGCATNH
jgi:Ribonuclease G/E